jgi:hypothetical protein
MITGIVVAIVVVVNALFGLGVFLRNQKAEDNILYAFFVGMTDAWIICNFLENEPSIVGTSYTPLFLRFDFVFAMFALYTWALFCGILMRNKSAGVSMARRAFYGIEFLCAFFFAASSFFGSLIITHVTFLGDIILFERGPLWWWYALLIVFFAIAGLWYLLVGHRRAVKAGRHIERQQIDLILVGFFVSAGTAIVINLFLQAFYPISITVSRIGIYGVTVLVALTGYAMTRSRLFDLRLAIARTVSFVLLLFGLAFAYALVFFAATAVFARETVNPSLFVPLLVATVAAALSFQPIERLFRKITDNFFSKSSMIPKSFLRS